MGFLEFISGKPDHHPQKVGNKIDSFVKGIMNEIGKNNIPAQRELMYHKFFIGLLIDEIQRNYAFFCQYEQNNLKIYSKIKAQGLTKDITFYEYAVDCLNHVDNHNAFLVNEFFNENSYLLTYKNNNYPHLVTNPLWIWPPFGFFSQMGDEYGGYDNKKNLAWIIKYINDSGTIYRF